MAFDGCTWTCHDHADLHEQMFDFIFAVIRSDR